MSKKFIKKWGVHKKKKYVIGLFGHYGNRNLGDESIIEATIQNLRERIPKVELKGLSINPLDTQERFKIESFPIRYKKDFFQEKDLLKHQNKNGSGFFRRIKAGLTGFLSKSPTVFGFLHLVRNLKSEIFFLREVKAQLEKMDALIVCGSNQFEDENNQGPWSYPYTLLKWIYLAKKTDTQVVIASVGAGPLAHSLSWWMIRKTVALAGYLSFRDHGSKKFIRKQISDVKAMVFPDLAHSLKTLPDDDRRDKKVNQPLVAVNPMPVFDRRYWPIGNKEKYKSYVKHLAQFLKYLVEKGFNVSLFNNHPKDRLVIKDLLEELEKTSEFQSEKINTVINKTVQDLVNTITIADVVVATRFHATVLPLRFGIPVLGICYQRKSKELLNDVNLGDYCVDFSSFTDQELCSKFDSLIDNKDTVRSNLNGHFRRYKKMSDKQWDLLAGLVAFRKNDKEIDKPVHLVNT